MIRFNFVGDLSLPKETSKRPFVRSYDKSGRQMKSMSFGVKSDRTNIGFVEMFGSQQEMIKTFDKDGNAIEVEWDDRNDPAILDTVRNSSLYLCNLGEGYEPKRFLSQYDMIEYLEENLPNIKDRVSVSGTVRKEFYNGQTLTKYNFRTVFAVAPDSTRPNQLALTVTEFVAPTDFDLDKEAKKLYINGYTQEYINRDEGNKFVPQQLVLDGSRVNDDHSKAVFQFKKKIIDRAAKKKTVQRGEFNCILINGAEEIPFDESQLTDDQKEAIELGLHVIDDYRPRGQIYGNRITEYRIVNLPLVGEYIDGYVDTEMKPSEMEDLIYVAPKTEKLSDIMPKPVEEKKVEPKTSKKSGYADDPDAIHIDEDDLFG